MTAAELAAALAAVRVDVTPDAPLSRTGLCGNPVLAARTLLTLVALTRGDGTGLDDAEVTSLAAALAVTRMTFGRTGFYADMATGQDRMSGIPTGALYDVAAGLLAAMAAA